MEKKYIFDNGGVNIKDDVVVINDGKIKGVINYTNIISVVLFSPSLLSNGYLSIYVKNYDFAEYSIKIKRSEEKEAEKVIAELSKKLNLDHIKEKVSNYKDVSLSKRLETQGFFVSRLFPLGLDRLYVDDENKRIAVNKNKTNGFLFYNYKDLIDFELVEDGTSIIKGSSLTSAVGGATFGVVGAIVGSSSSRKLKPVCSSLVLRLFINDLNNPLITFELLNSDTNKDGFVYKTMNEAAQNAVAGLKYIQSQNG
jgi:hypothetical protein